MASRSEAWLAVAAAAALAACETREPDVHPFHVVATANGVPMEQLAAAQTYYVLYGTAEVLGEASLRIAQAIFGDGAPFGDLEISWDPGPAPDATLDPAMGGQAVRVLLLVDPSRTAPDGAPLPVPGFRIATGTSPDFRHRLLIWEATYQTDSGTASVFAPAGVHELDPDFPDIPDFVVEPVYAAFEPAECGLVYYDALDVFGLNEDAVALDVGELGRMPIGAVEPEWNVLHVQSWHRDGACDGQTQAWSQFVAWRPPVLILAQ